MTRREAQAEAAELVANFIAMRPPLHEICEEFTEDERDLIQDGLDAIAKKMHSKASQLRKHVISEIWQ